MARLSAIVAATAVAITTATTAVRVSGATLPAALSREEAALAESVRESRLVVLADTCDGACMEAVRARLATRCNVRVLPNIHMLSARCSDTSGSAAAGDGAPPPASVEELLSSLPEVEATVPDSVVSMPPAKDGAAVEPTTREATSPTTSRQSETYFWGLDRVNQFSLPLDGDKSVDQCYPSLGAGVSVYVVDTGCSTGHPQFEGRATAQAGPGSSYRSGADDNSHGSHVAGTVGGRDTGVAPRVTLRCLKVLNSRGSGSSADIAAAFDAVAGAKAQDPSSRIILSASLGGFSPPGQPSVTGIAAQRASAAGVVTVVAAGNDGGDACSVSPASESNVMTVANADRYDRLARSSNRGKCVDIIAPGTNILSVDGDSRSGGLKRFSGTSMATPHVAGVAALILGDTPDSGRLTTADVYQRMITAAPRVAGYPMAYTGGTDCSGDTPGPAPLPEPTPTPEPREPDVCSRTWRRFCDGSRRWRRRFRQRQRPSCQWVLVCAETGQPVRSRRA